MAADWRGMAGFTFEVWAVLGVVAAGMLLAILGAAANARREECRLHDLKIRVHELRDAYHRRLADMRRRAGETVDPDLVSDA